MDCEKCSAPNAREMISTKTRTVALCHACASIEANKIGRRVQYFLSCSHAWTPFKRERAPKHWSRRCIRCGVEDEEISHNRPHDEIEWMRSK